MSKLAVQDLEKLDVNTLNALSPEVISRQATINIGAPAPGPLPWTRSDALDTHRCFASTNALRRWLRRLHLDAAGRNERRSGHTRRRVWTARDLLSLQLFSHGFSSTKYALLGSLPLAVERHDSVSSGHVTRRLVKARGGQQVAAMFSCPRSLAPLSDT
eukprot:6195223-Pleurochrysis_carterae.AAC.1